MNRRGENPYEAFRQSNTGKLRASRSENLFSRRKKRFPLGRIVLAALLMVVLLGGGYNVILNSGVRVQTVTVAMPGLPSAFEGYTLLHLSDLYGTHLGDGHAKLAKALSGQTYSAVCITGDMTAANGDAQAFLDLLDLLGSKKPILFVAGEQDPPVVLTDASQGESVLADYVVAAQQRGAVYVDAPVYLESMGKRIWFTPESALTLDVESTMTTLSERLALEQAENASGADAYMHRQSLEYQLDRVQRIADAREMMSEDELCVVLTHAPLDEAFISGTSQLGVVNKLISRIDLILAGHFNGGQATLPFIGPIYLPGAGFFPGAQGVSGLVRTGELLAHISPGLGVNPRHLIPMRLFNPPAVTLVKLTGKIE